MRRTNSLFLSFLLIAVAWNVRAYDRLGSDLGPGVPVPNANGCNTLCNGNGSCVSWVFVATGNPRFANTTPLCFLKSAIPSPSFNPTCPSNVECVSGIKRTDGWCGEDPNHNIPGSSSIQGQGDVLTCAGGGLCASVPISTTINTWCWFFFIPYPCHQQSKLQSFDHFCSTGAPAP